MRTIIHWILLGLGIVLIFNLSRSIIDLSRRGAVLHEAEETLNTTQEDYAGLNQELSYVQSPEFIEKQAREKLNMSRIGDVVVIPPDVPPPPVPTPQDTRRNWEKWRDIFK